jgi:acyl carrier protein
MTAAAINALIADRVRNVIAGELGIAANMLTDEKRLREDLGADSLNLYEIAFTLEDELALSPISDDEIEQMVTVANLIKLIEAKQEAAHA